MTATDAEVVAAWYRRTKLSDPRTIGVALAVNRAIRWRDAAFVHGTGLQLYRASNHLADLQAEINALHNPKRDYCERCGRPMHGDPSICIRCHPGESLYLTPRPIRPSTDCGHEIPEVGYDEHACEICFDKLLDGHL